MSENKNNNSIGIITIITLIGVLIAILNDGTGFYEWLKSKFAEEEKVAEQMGARPPSRSREIEVKDNGTYIEGNQTIIYEGGNNGDDKTPDEPMEIVDVIDIFTQEPESEYALNWDVGSESNINIKWLHEGTLWDYEVKEGGEFYDLRGFFKNCDSPSARVGKLQISMDKNPTHTILRRKKEPADWFIQLCGANVGVLEVKLTTHTGSNYFCGFESYFSSKGMIIEGSIEKYTKKHSHSWQEHFTSYEIILGDKRVHIIEETGDGGGKLGCFTEIRFVTSNIRKMNFPEVIM